MSAKDVCRTCFQSGGTMFPLFDANATLPLDSPVFTFIEMLQFFTDIHIPYQDGCPIQLCTDCHDDVHRIYTFILKCRRSDAILKQLKDVKTRLTKQRNESNQEKRDNATTDSGRLENESFEMKKIKEEPYSDYPMEEPDTAAERGESFLKDREIFVDGHLVKVKEEPELDVKKIKEEPFSDPMEQLDLDTDPERDRSLLRLQRDRDTIDNESFLDGHLVQVKEEPELDIENENLEYPTRTEISNNDQDIDLDMMESLFESDVADNQMEEEKIVYSLNSKEYEISVQRSLTEASTSDSSETTTDVVYICSECFEAFPSERKFDEHMKNHSQEIEQFDCELCSKQHRSKYDLRVHMIKEHSRRKHKCDLCGKLLTRRCHLKRHMEAHANGNLLKCEFCTHHFCSKTSLPHHMRTKHLAELLSLRRDTAWVKNYMETMDDKKFTCEICLKKFRTEPLLEQHVKTHMVARPFRCEICDRDFRTKHHLKCHDIRIHPFDSSTTGLQCDICSRFFACKSDFERHSHTHTGEKPFKCDICKEEYRYKRFFNNHMQEKHGIFSQST